ncbi:MAG TPA: NAD-dependent epimerase/dehydratase family protein [Chloroflexota bacterium]|nr:NAD-dependent epimerase/dehydratase family protein [Chloroflexota bacterium]
MRALVTGGAGFIGSHLCRRLIANDWTVTCLDNFVSGLRRNISGLHEHPSFQLVECDVSAGPLPDDLAADRYYHLASPASPNAGSPRSYMALPLATALVNSVGLQHVLDLARQAGGRVLFASTSEIYGDPHEHPQREEYWGNVSSTGRRSCYDEAKRFGEALCMIYVRSFGLDVRLVRIFNTYGPNMDPEDGRMLPNFIIQALRDKPLTIYGDGQFTRSLCYVDDLVNGLVAVMESERTDAPGRVYNLGNPDEHTIREYAELVLDLVPGTSSTLTYLDPVPDDPTRRRPDIGRARRELSWEPRVELRDGVGRTIDYFREVTGRP